MVHEENPITGFNICLTFLLAQAARRTGFATDTDILDALTVIFTAYATFKLIAIWKKHTWKR